MEYNVTARTRPHVDTAAPARPPPLYMGPLTGGPQCRMSNLRNVNVPCHYLWIIHVVFKNSLMSHVKFKKMAHVMSLIFYSHVNKVHVACRF